VVHVGWPRDPPDSPGQWPTRQAAHTGDLAQPIPGDSFADDPASLRVPHEQTVHELAELPPEGPQR